MIEKMNLHYSFTNPASIHDEEALTALELAGRQGAKINEVIEDQNNLRTETENHLSEQDTRLEIFKAETIPAEVAGEVQNHIRKGSFDKAIDEYVNDLETRVNKLIGGIPAGGTSMDAEVVDARTGADGRAFATVGDAIREQVDSMIKPVYLEQQISVFVVSETLIKNDGYIAEVQFTPTGNASLIGWANTLNPNQNYTLIIEAPEDVEVYRPYLCDSAQWNLNEGVEMEISRNVRKGNTKYIDFIYTHTGNKPRYFNVRFNGGNGTPCKIRLSIVSNLANVPGRLDIGQIETPVILYGLSTMFPSQSVEYLNGTYVAQVDYTAESNLAFMVFNREFSQGETFRVRIRTDKPVNPTGIWLKTVPNINSEFGSSAVLVEDIVTLDGQNHEIFFKVVDNSVNADNLMIRFDATAGETYNFQIDITKLFYHDFNKRVYSDPFIAFIGDSLTAQGYQNYIDSGSVGKQGYAVGGEGVTQIFKRTGVIPWRCTNTTIEPGANVLTHDGGGLFAQGMGNVNPVMIAGVSGFLSRDASGNVVFTPENLTETVPVYNPEIIPNLSALSPVAYVLWAGTNNMQGTAEEIFSAWKMFMKVHPNSVIVGLTRDPESTFLDMVHTLDPMGEQEFGVRYLAVHDWLVNHGLAFNGLTATSADSAAIAAGKIPPALLSDAIHFNEYGKKAVAHLVEERLKTLGVL